MTASTQRFMRKGTTRFFFVPTIASTALIPSHTEVAAGTELTGQVHDVKGFSFTNTPIKTPDMANTFTSEIPGEDASAASSLDLYERRGGTVIDALKAVLTKGTLGFMVIFFIGTATPAPAAAAAGDLADVWPVTISANSRAYMATNDAAKYSVDFSITAPPAQDIAIT